MTQHHEEEAIDKAYDAHLMRRLLRYLSPYKLQVLSSMVVIGVASLLQVSSPYLTKVGIILERKDKRVRVIIEDDGVGFDAEKLMSGPVDNRRLGLMGMQERVQLVGGEFKIDSGAGTTIVVTIPVSLDR